MEASAVRHTNDQDAVVVQHASRRREGGIGMRQLVESIPDRHGINRMRRYLCFSECSTQDVQPLLVTKSRHLLSRIHSEHVPSLFSTGGQKATHETTDFDDSRGYAWSNRKMPGQCSDFRGRPLALKNELRAQVLVTVTLLAIGIRNGLGGRPSITVKESATTTGHDRRDMTFVKSARSDRSSSADSRRRRRWNCCRNRT